jgi:hypothetical protein
VVLSEVGEAQQIERKEEQLVGGAEDEQYFLYQLSVRLIHRNVPQGLHTLFE